VPPVASKSSSIQLFRRARSRRCATPFRLRRTQRIPRLRSDRGAALFCGTARNRCQARRQRQNQKETHARRCRTILSIRLLRNWCRKISTEARNNTPSFRIGVISLKIIPVFGKSGHVAHGCVSLEASLQPSPGPMLAPRTERSNAVQLVAKRSAALLCCTMDRQLLIFATVAIWRR